MALSESSSFVSESAAPPKVSTEFSRPRRPRRRCSIPTPLSASPATCILFPFDPQRNHLEGPYRKTHGAIIHLDRALVLFEEAGALYAFGSLGKPEGALTPRPVRLVEAQDRSPPVLGRLERPERELEPIGFQEPVRGGLSAAFCNDKRAVEPVGFA